MEDKNHRQTRESDLQMTPISELPDKYFKILMLKMQITTMRYYLTWVKWLSSKRTQITNICEDVGKEEPLYTVGGNVY